MRGKAITIEQEKLMIKLYKKGWSIKQIMKETEIRSEQTVYRLLDQNGVPRRPKRQKSKITFSATPESIQILSCQKDVSEFINKAILKACQDN